MCENIRTRTRWRNGTILLRPTVVESDRAIGRLVTSSHPSSSLIGCLLLALGMASQECLARADRLNTCYSHTEIIRTSDSCHVVFDAS